MTSSAWLIQPQKDGTTEEYQHKRCSDHPSWKAGSCTHHTVLQRSKILHLQHSWHLTTGRGRSSWSIHTQPGRHSMALLPPCSPLMELEEMCLHQAGPFRNPWYPAFSHAELSAPGETTEEHSLMQTQDQLCFPRDGLFVQMLAFFRAAST